MRWDEIVRGVAEPAPATLVRPDAARHAIYRELMPVYTACEAHALGRGPDPAEPIGRFRSRLAAL